MTRKALPSRRAQWTQKIRMEGQVFYLACGEYDDGSLGEVFLDASKSGTFTQGILTALGRVISVALQCGTPADEIIKALSGLSFPPCGMVSGSPNVQESLSIADWVANELKCVYQSLPEKSAGHMPESWRSGA